MKLIVSGATGRVLGYTQWDDPVDGAALVDVPDGYDLDHANDYRWDDGEEAFVLDPLPPPPPSNLAALKAERLAALADRRWQAETSGTTVAGMPIATDERSQAKIAGAALAAVLDEDYSVQWKTNAGFVTLDRAMVLGLAQGVRAHIQGCFDREAALAADIETASDPSTLVAIDIHAGWPA